MSLVMSKVGGKWNKWRKMGEGGVSVVVVKARVPCLQFRLSLGILLLIIDLPVMLVLYKMGMQAGRC